MENQVRPLKMTEKLPDMVNTFWKDVWEKKKEGKLIAWCSGSGPFELLKAMDIEVVWPESYGGLCAVAGISTEQCERADALGYSSDLCSCIRTFIGAVDGKPAIDPGKLPFGGLPKPDLLVCKCFCPGIYRTWERWSRELDIPLLVMERPRLHDGITREEIAHFTREGVEELTEMAGVLAKITGRPLDYDRLSEMLALEREAAGLWWDIVGMCRNKPAPMSAFDAFTQFYPFFLHRGTSKAVDYYRELKAELDERVADKVGALVGEEKYRLYWDNLPIFFKLQDHIPKFASYGALPVVGNFPFYYGFFPEDQRENPLETMFEMLFYHPANRGLQGRIDFITRQMEGFDLDGLVMQRTRTCLVVNMGQDDIMQALIRQTGLPAVVVEGDICDSRFYSEADFNSKIEAFMEILERKDSPAMSS